MSENADAHEPLPSPEPAAAEAPPAGRQPGVGFVLAIVFLDIAGMGLAIPVGPSLVASFLGNDLSHAAVYVGLQASLYTGMMFASAPLLGALSDRFGRKPVLLTTLALQVASYFGAAFAPSLWLFLLARALGGIGGGNLAVAQTYIADVSAPHERAKNFGLIGAAFGVGFVVGPAIGGWLGSFGLTYPFLAAGAVALGNWLYGAVVLPESHRPENRRAFRWQEANPLGFIVVLKRHAEVRQFVYALVFVWFGQQAMYNTWVLYTSLRYGWGPADNGASLAAVGIMAAIVQGGLMGRLLPLLGERMAAVGGLLWSAAIFVGYGLAPTTWLIYVLIVVGAVAGIAMPTLQGMVSRLVGPAEQGAVQGSLTSLASLTGIFAPLVANGAFAYFTSPAAPMQVPGIAFFLGAATMALGALIVDPLIRNRPAPAAAEAGA